MKKLVLVVVAMFAFSVAVFSAGEINVKVGPGLSVGNVGSITLNTKETKTKKMSSSEAFPGFISGKMTINGKNVKDVEFEPVVKTSKESDKYYALDILGGAIACEYLLPVSDWFKLGIGLEYSLNEVEVEGTRYITTLSNIPVYFTVQVNPAKRGFFVKGNLGYAVFFSDEEKILKDKNWRPDTWLRHMQEEKIFKNNDIYPRYTNFESLTDIKEGWEKDSLSVKNKYDLYYAASVGYEFSSGLILDLTYSHYTASSTTSGSWVTSGSNSYGSHVRYAYEISNQSDFNYGKISINIGYKFKL